MNIERRVNLDAAEGNPRNRDISYYHETASDEIDLGDLIRNLIREWKTMAIVMAIGVIGAIAIAFYLPQAYLIEATLRIPTTNELGAINEQNIIQIDPDMALRRVVDQLLAGDAVKETLENGNWLKEPSANRILDIDRKARAIRDGLSIVVVRHGYYELTKDEKAPFKEINVSMQSGEPEPAAEFVQMLINNAQHNALVSLSSDISRIKDTQVGKIQEQLRSLTLAAKQSREAEVMRLQEANREAISRLEQQIDMKLRQATRGRENRIVQLAEALKTATQLGIKEPVTWDDLSLQRKATQITNEIGGKDGTAPLYFRGIRLLEAELVQLKERADDRPFIVGLTELEIQILQIQDDPKIAALKSRVNDTIYIEKYDDLKRQISSLLGQPTQFQGAQMAVVTRPALVPNAPTRSPWPIVLVGLLLSGFVALIIALIRMSIRNSELRQNQIRLADQ